MEFYISEDAADGYSPYHILLDDTKILNAIADEKQKAKGKLPLFDDSGEYDPNDWYDFFLQCDITGVKRLYYQYGMSGEYGDEILLSEREKKKAFRKVLDFFGGMKGYKEYIKENG